MHDPHASLLRVQLLPTSSAIEAQLAAATSPSPAKRPRALHAREAAAGLVLPPGSLDALDGLVLRYEVGWPLGAVITPDTLQVGPGGEGQAGAGACERM